VIHSVNSNPLDLATTSSPETQSQFQPNPPAPRGLGWLSSTQLLIAANVLMFLSMLFYGIWHSGGQRFLDTPIGTGFDDKALLLWGGNYGPLTLGGQYWRVVTCLFVHLNTFHLASNMLLLWRLGKPLERLLNRKRHLIIYLFTGATSSLTSLAWHPTSLKLGSSGAIFGQAGALIALLGFGKLNLPRRQTLGIVFWLVLMTPFGLILDHFDKTTDYLSDRFEQRRGGRWVPGCYSRR
jgi:membrane associated rhomboid family serine protease